MSAAPNPVIVVSPDELRDLVRSAVREALEERGPEKPASPWLDAKGAAELLGVSSRQVAKLAQAGSIPSSRLGSLLRFRREDVLAALERGARVPRLKAVG